MGYQALSKLGLDITNINITKLDGDGYKDVASSISRNSGSERWDEFWTLVKNDAAEISSRLENAQHP